MKTTIQPRNATTNAARFAQWAIAAVVLASTFGCATVSGQAPNPIDPLEPFNRSVFRFNEGVDRAVLRPVATAYRDTLPLMVRTGVSNFFGNLGDVWSLANNVMQLKLQNSAETFMRLNVNTIFGLGGLLDIASEAGIERHREDFGQTLGRWGVPTGPYVVLPLLGPSTVRDTAALPVDHYGDVLSVVHDIGARNSLYALRVVDERATFLRAGQMLDEIALDKYSFTRDAFMQHRRSEVSGGGASGGDGE
ncbi:MULTISPECIES: VacJ family lipoprotein [unclassified Variovorax]|uniref:MlaA family lipoprotein n=1 Tax=unclassified Variovorax TaxID=663243 RepID=UPI002B23C373|nr:MULTISPECIES: VacJ family lipoprotein [unclassified Variovorax]MEB0055228.1 VacJ family lipoprotein [Variovorax sp. LG9.2]MEB0110125.1 VacJ family lipoprotein [Variovorax sp. RTB1]